MLKMYMMYRMEMNGEDEDEGEGDCWLLIVDGWGDVLVIGDWWMMIEESWLVQHWIEEVDKDETTKMDNAC